MSKASYESIDYNLRPSKSIERKMLADLFRRLDRVSALRHYQYVGFGSPFFADFSMFHKQLDIQSMISIERELEDEARFRFNKPFAAVELMFGESSQVLPQLDWDHKTILWLDYDDPLDTSMLNDVDLAINNLPSGSVLVVSASAQLSWDPAERLTELKDNLDTNVPPGLTEDDLGGWDIAALYRSIIDERIRDAIRDKNAGRSTAVTVEYEQLVNFQYADGAKMVTVGGLLANRADRGHYRACNFDEFEFYRPSGDPYRIKLPRLTPREFRHLDALLPNEESLDATDVGIPVAQSNKYSAVYRYFPKFLDVEG